MDELLMTVRSVNSKGQMVETLKFVCGCEVEWTTLCSACGTSYSTSRHCDDEECWRWN